MRQASPPFDRAMGRWLKTQRMALELSQERFWSPLGLSFQQGQKYESGANRVSFMVLVKLATTYKFSLDALGGYLAGYLKGGATK